MRHLIDCIYWWRWLEYPFLSFCYCFSKANVFVRLFLCFIFQYFNSAKGISDSNLERKGASWLAVRYQPTASRSNKVCKTTNFFKENEITVYLRSSTARSRPKPTRSLSRKSTHSSAETPTNNNPKALPESKWNSAGSSSLRVTILNHMTQLKLWASGPSNSPSWMYLDNPVFLMLASWNRTIFNV